MRMEQLSPLGIPTEEDRRLLREYRITTIPSRRSSKASTPSGTLHDHSTSVSSASSASSASSSSCSSISSSSISTIGSGILTNISGGKSGSIICASIITNPDINPADHHHNSEHNNHHRHHNQEQDNHDQKQHHGHNNVDNKDHHHRHRHHHNHHPNHNGHHKHHHRNNHKRHKSHSNQATIKDLSPEEISRVLDLSSKLGFLKLVQAKESEDEMTKNKNDESTKTKCKNIKENKSNGTISLGVMSYGDKSGQVKSKNNEEQQQPGNGLLSISPIINEIRSNNDLNYYLNSNKRFYASNSEQANFNNSKTYMFEKVDYLKKINARRKALRKLKKDRKKSLRDTPEQISPTTNATNNHSPKESPKIVKL